MIQNHSRWLILEYLYQYKDLPIDQMTIVVLGKNYPDSLVKLINPNDYVYIYHARGLRVFSKSYPFDKATNSITEMVLTMGERLDLTYQDFTYAINDPYYLKDVRQLDFKKMIIIPLFDSKQMVIAYAIYYLGEIVNDFTIDNKRLAKLLSDIIDDEVVVTNEAISKHVKYRELWTVQKDNQIYLSNPLILKLGLTNALQTVDDVTNLLEGWQISSTSTWEDLIVKIYQTKADDNKTLFYGFNEINNHRLTDFDTVLYFQYLGIEIKSLNEHFLTISKHLNYLTNDTSYLLYQVSDSSLVIIFKEFFHQKRIDSFKQKLKFYRIISLRSNKEIHNKMDLQAIISFIHQADGDVFKLNEYLKYRQQNEKDQLIINSLTTGNLQLKFKDIINSLNHSRFATYLEQFSINNEYYENLFQKTLINQLYNSYFPFFQIKAKNLNNREIWNSLKKISNQQNEKIGIIIRDADIEMTLLVSYFNRLNSLGYFICVDQSLFMNLDKVNLLNYYGGIFICDKVFNRMENDHLWQEIMKYYLHNNKIILIETSKKPLPYQHELIFFIK